MAREEKGWSQKELARRSGVDASIINRVEFGAKLTEKQGVKLAEALEVGISWLLLGNEKTMDVPDVMHSNTEARVGRQQDST